MIICPDLYLGKVKINGYIKVSSKAKKAIPKKLSAAWPMPLTLAALT